MKGEEQSEIMSDISMELENVFRKYRNKLNLRTLSLMVMSIVFANALLNEIEKEKIAEMVKEAMKMAKLLIDVQNSEEFKNFEEGVEE